MKKHRDREMEIWRNRTEGQRDGRAEKKQIDKGTE
jgi:hypothetical protein